MGRRPAILRLVMSRPADAEPGGGLRLIAETNEKARGREGLVGEGRAHRVRLESLVIVGGIGGQDDKVNETLPGGLGARHGHQADFSGSRGEVGHDLGRLGRVVVDTPGPPQLVAITAEAPQPRGSSLAISVRENCPPVLKDLDLVKIVEIRRGLILAPDSVFPRGGYRVRDRRRRETR